MSDNGASKVKASGRLSERKLVSYRLSVEALEILQRIAQQRKISRTYVMENAIREWAKKHDGEI
ncbi:MAG: ribbon-helix-helix protein, CopG family [Isosphaeraceae bacterium]